MLNIVETVAISAGKKLLPYFEKHIQAQEKIGHQNLVSEADLASQEYIQNSLLEHMQTQGIPASEIGFLGEEGLDKKGTYTFIIDPLDGTTNFISGITYFAVSIACLKDGVLESGVTYNPVTDTLFKAEKGKGSFKVQGNEQTQLKIRETKLKESNLNTYYSSNSQVRNQMFLITEALFPEIRAMRIWGSGTLELAQFAENLTNIILYGKCGVWDVAVAKLIIQESGGSLTDWQGVPIELDLVNHDRNYQTLACHPSHLEVLTTKIREALKSSRDM
jgi:myo-inositol-1(or 4)-monophosphatase